MSPPPGEGRGSWRGLDGNSPNGEDGDRELYELDVDIEVGPLFRKSPFPSSDLPDPDLELLSKFSPFLVLLLFPHMIFYCERLFFYLYFLGDFVEG